MTVFNIFSRFWVDDKNDSSSLAWALINIGRIYKFKDDYDKELYYYNKSLEISLKSRNEALF